MKILKILSSEDKGGIYTCETQFIRELRKRGIVVDGIILGNGEKLEQYKELCNNTWVIPLLDINYSGSTANILRSILISYNFGAAQAAHLQKQLKPGAYDAIIYRRPIYIHLAGKLSKLLKTACFWHLPNTVNSSFSRKYYNFFCKKYDIVQVANSSYTKETLGKQCEHVVYPGYDSTRVTEGKRAYRAKLGLNEAAPVYGMASRIYKDKAQDIVVKAFVSSNIPAAGGHLLVAGGPLDSDFAQMVQEHAGALLHKQIHFLGQTKDMPEFYSSVDVIINGRRNAEPFGISVAEAMGAGKPVMAYYLGGPSEMVVHNESGWLIPKPTVEGYRAALNESLEKREQWTAMGASAKAGANRFSVKSNVDKLVEIIASL